MKEKFSINNKNKSIIVQHGDITTFEGDAIVNAANPHLAGGAGVCGAIFNAAGFEEMIMACQKYDGCDYGEAVITPGFNLKAKYVIHTVGPIYGQHNGAEPDILKSCYWQSLRLAQDNNLKSIAFPLISSGVYGYPKEEAKQLAIEAVHEFFEDTPNSSIEKVVLFEFP